MTCVNIAILLGRLTHDPEVRYTSGGTTVCNFSLAINETYTKNNEVHEKTTFVDVTAWGNTAESAGRYLSKGRMVHVEGRLTQDTWEDRQTGQSRSKLLVTARSIQFLPDGNGRSNGNAQSQRQPQQRRSSRPHNRQRRRQPAPTAPAPNGYQQPAPNFEDDVPF